MKIAIVGCAHGEIEEIISAIQLYEKQRSCSIDLLLCCGDFQAVRNYNDLITMACPVKYKKLNTFYKYYSGELVTPFPIILIGGNHEASNYLMELYHGGFVAPNIYYLGAAGSIMFGGLRICGISGIFKAYDFNSGQYETLPLNKDDKYSIYHIRRYNIWKLSQLHNNNIDIFLSHDWPTCIWKYGNYRTLIKYKPHFRNDCLNNKLGNPSLNHLLFQLQPKQWFSGHLHCKFSAIINHKDTKNVTRFLATDKFDKKNKRRKFIQMLDFINPTDAKRDNTTGFYKFEYDPVWLAIIKSTNKYLSINKNPIILPQPNPNNKFNNDRWDYRPNTNEINDILKLFNNDLTINQDNFVQTVSIPNSNDSLKSSQSPHYIVNKQTQYLMDKLGIIDKIAQKHLNIQKYQKQQIMFNNVVNNNTLFNVNNNNNNVSKDNDNDDGDIFKWNNSNTEITDNTQSNNSNSTLKRVRDDDNNTSLEDPNEIDIDIMSEPSPKRTKQ